MNSTFRLSFFIFIFIVALLFCYNKFFMKDEPVVPDNQADKYPLAAPLDSFLKDTIPIHKKDTSHYNGHWVDINN